MNAHAGIDKFGYHKLLFSGLLWITVSIISITKIQAQSGPPAEGSCEQTMETHAFLTRGQFQCGFRSYGGGMLEAARACSKKMRTDEVNHWLESGMKLYDFNEGKRGHAAMCASLLVDFPKILRK